MPVPTPQTNRADMAATATKAFSRIASKWRLSVDEAAALSDTSASTWKRAKSSSKPPALTYDQILRLSAVVGIYKALNLYFDGPLADEWITRPNTGPLFEGKRPVDVMLDGGLPMFLEVRNYLDALRGGS